MIKVPNGKQVVMKIIIFFLNSFDIVQMYISNITITVRLHVTRALTVRISHNYV